MRFIQIIMFAFFVVLSSGCMDQVDNNGTIEQERSDVIEAYQQNNDNLHIALEDLEHYIIERIEEVTKKKFDDILIEDLHKITMFYINAENVTSSTDLTFLSLFPNLEELTLIQVEGNDYSILTKLSRLEKLRFIGGNIYEHIDVITSLTNLNYLDIEQNKIENIAFLMELPNLIELSLYANDITSLDGIQNLKQLERLSLRNNAVTNIEELKAIENLRFLELYNNNISDITPLGALINLEHLNLSQNNITDISPLLPLKDNLTTLFISSNKISDIGQLSHFNSLTFVDISHNPISDISNLSIPSLKRLHMVRTDIDDLSFIENNPNLRFLDMRNTYVISIRPLINLEYLEILLLNFEQIEDLDLLEDKDVQISEENILG